MYILGISAHYHDASVCLVREGEVIFAASEERFSRQKNDPKIPVLAYQRALNHAGITPDDLSAVAYYEEPLNKAGRQLATALTHCNPLRELAKIETLQPSREIQEALGFEGKVLFYPHHLCHAASAYFFSGFCRCAVLVVDAVGEWTTTSHWLAEKGALQALNSIDFPDSIGLLYSAITVFLGFEANEGEYKVMGLAPYGRPQFVDAIRSLISSSSGGNFSLNLEYFCFDTNKKLFSDTLCEVFGVPARRRESSIDPVHCDIAASLQLVLEQLLLSQCKVLHQATGSRSLAFAGGVALNCVANSRIRRESDFRDVYIQPAAGDAGGAIGAGLLAYTQLGHPGAPRDQVDHMYLGDAISTRRLRIILDNAGVRYADFTGASEQQMQKVAKRLSEGAIVGWCQGRMEFGPRALGARSILADPRRPEIKDRINALVKLRESFRPFAPVALLEAAEEYFETGGLALPFMLETVQVRPNASLPAITHVDGSARLQTVSRFSSTPLAALLEAFGNQTGCAVLLNTSFNQKGEPIVATAEDALECFLRCQLDVLVVDTLILERQDIPETWRTFFDGHSERTDSTIPTNTYTLL